MASLGIDAVIEPAAEGCPRLTRGGVIRLGKVPLDIKDGDVENTHGKFRPAGAIQPGGVVMDGGKPLRVCGDGVAERHGPRIDGQLLEKGRGPVAGKAKEYPKENDKSALFSFHS